MDLGAYVQIEDLEKVARDNGIHVPRLRGYRLMVTEKPLTLEEFCGGLDKRCVEDLCYSYPFWSPHTGCSVLSSRTMRIKDYYLGGGKIRWDRIHGWKRKVLKTYIHNEKRNYQKQIDVFNRYAGRPDVLYVHARIGGGNWPYYHSEVDTKPWFIEKIDDGFDSTYCDIYARVKVEVEPDEHHDS